MRSGRLRAVLLNDCLVASHLGTVLVARNLAAGLSGVGVDLVGRYPRGFSRWDARFDRVLEQTDVVIINGEGTCHHDAPDAARFFEAARRAHEKGKAVVLLNTVWQDNPNLKSFLRYVDRLFVRESASAADLRHAGHVAAVVPDLSLAADLDGRRQPATGLPLVTDAVGYEDSLALGEFATSRRWPFRPMRRWFRGILLKHPRRVLRVALACSGGVSPLDATDYGLIGNASTILTGRFHGVCLALIAGRPFVALSSNTHKIEAMATDMGLRELILTGRTFDIDAITRLMEMVQEEGYRNHVVERIAAYIGTARQAQQAMLLEIRTLASGR